MMTLSSLRWLVAGTLVFGASWAMAGDEPKPDMTRAERAAKNFAESDTDANGTLSLEEFKAGHEKRVAARKEHLGDKWDPEMAAKGPSVEDKFAKIDKDGDAQLTQDEMKAWNQERSEKMRGERHDRRAARKGQAESDEAAGEDTPPSP
jgi:hypothetical protein